MRHLEGGKAGMTAGRTTETGDITRAETECLLQNSSQSLSEVSSRESQKPQTRKQNQNTTTFIVSQQSYRKSIIPSLL